MIVETVVVGPFGVNCYILGCEQTSGAAIIDPGAEEDDILTKVEEMHLRVESVLITHGHIDHIGGVSGIKERTGARVYMHQADKDLIDIAPLQARLFGLTRPQPFTVDTFVEDGDTITIGRMTLDVLETPGHSPGGISFSAADSVFSGDALFYESIGRTDLPGGSLDQLARSIKGKLFNLPDNTVVYPGHGPATSIAHEKKFNPFMR
jgi:glyoxylase-like metal-dependent hydrolase (beta-lactamase superfamily II)